MSCLLVWHKLASISFLIFLSQILKPLPVSLALSSISKLSCITFFRLHTWSLKHLILLFYDCYSTVHLLICWNIYFRQEKLPQTIFVLEKWTWNPTYSWTNCVKIVLVCLEIQMYTVLAGNTSNTKSIIKLQYCCYQPFVKNMKLHSFLKYLMLTFLVILFRLHVRKEECLDFDTDTE